MAELRSWLICLSIGIAISALGFVVFPFVFDHPAIEPENELAVAYPETILLIVGSSVSVATFMMAALSRVAFLVSRQLLLKRADRNRPANRSMLPIQRH